MSDTFTSLNGSTGLSFGAMSARGKIWAVPREMSVDSGILKAAGGDEIIAELLQRRGIKNADEALAFLDSSTYEMTSPHELPDVDKVVARITQSIQLKEKITVYGDYDVDGVTGTSVLLTVLRRLGANVDYYIPNRSSEGYGLNLKAVSILASKHRTKLIVTCDCGVSNFAEINLARSLGVDTVVLDHHSMPELLPPAVGIVHPKRLHEEHPLFHLPGVGVAYKVCEALLIDNGHPEEVADLLDFVTLGMIADLVPLVKENRHLVRVGLTTLVNSKRPGIQALLAQVKTSGDTDVVAFGLAPRINAVGRLSDAGAAVELLTTDDQATAENLAKQLQLENSRRQELCDQIFSEANQMVVNTIDLSKDRAIAIYKEGWHHGVVGIVASRLVEKYSRPVFIGELDAKEGIVKGSARGIEAIDLYQVLKKNAHLLNKWGGHKMAAGWGVEADKAAVLCRALTDTCNLALATEPLTPILHIDAKSDPAKMDLDLAKSQVKLAPFGMGNRKPVLMMSGLVCANTRVLGKEGKHHRIMLEHTTGGAPFEAVMWNTQGIVPQDGEVVDVAFTPEVNSFNGRERLQLVVADWRRQGADAHPMVEEETDVAAAAEIQEFVSEGEVREPALAGSKSGADPQPMRAIRSQMTTWKDLRNFKDTREVLQKAGERLGVELAIFAETMAALPGFTFDDRTTIGPASNLLILEVPPSLKVLKEILSKTNARNVFFVGNHSSQLDEPGAFLKHLFGLVKYAINKKDGQVEADKLTAAMGTSKMAVALGLSVLRKLHVIDWFAEDGTLFLDLIGAPEGQPDDLLEYRQLSEALDSVLRFRAWCAETTLKEIQLAISPNQVGLARGKSDSAFSTETEDALEVNANDECDESPEGSEV